MSIVGAFVLPHPPLAIPEVGRGTQQKIQRTLDSYDLVAHSIAELQPQTVVVITPHGPGNGQAIGISTQPELAGDFRRFDAASVSMILAGDQELAQAVMAEAWAKGVTIANDQEETLDHGCMLPLYFLNRYYAGYKLLRVCAGGSGLEEHYRLGECIQAAAEALDRDTVVIASADLSHRLLLDGSYGYAPEGPQFDAEVVAALKTADFEALLELDEELCEGAGQCGLRPILTMAGALDRYRLRVGFLSYEGPYGVGYAACAYEIAEQDISRSCLDKVRARRTAVIARIREKEDPYAMLARQALEYYVSFRKRMERPGLLPLEMTTNEAGVFVSIKSKGQLRGCIGTLVGICSCVADEIMRNAIEAGTRDPRFPAVTTQELDELVYSVDVLGPLERVDSWSELDPKRYGVVVKKGERKGLLLPNLAGVDSVRTQMEIALRKAGIRPDTQYEMYRFEVVRHR